MLKKVCFVLILVSLFLLPSGFYPAVTSGRAASGVMLGIYPNGSIGTGNHEITLLDAYFGTNRVSLAGGFVDWESNTSSVRSELDYAWNNGYWPVLNIGAGNVADPICTDNLCTAARIASGELDSAITSWAQEFKDWTDNGTKKAYLAPLQEMNGSWVDYYGDPANYILAYTHIQDIFLTDVGVDPDSVVWIFAPNGWSEGTFTFEDYYPGDSAVDVVGFSSFNWGECFTGTSWETYTEIYEPYLGQMAAMAPGKPIWIMEMASHTVGGDRDVWFDEVLTSVANYSGVEAVMYFNRAEDPHNPNLLPACNTGAGLIDYGLDYDGAEGKARFKTEILQAPYVFSSPTNPEIDLQGNSLSIIDGDSVPSTADHTDFGSVDVSSGSVAHTFVVENTGTANLFLTGTTMVEISGANAADFTVTAAPSGWFVALGGGTESFEITFDPSGEGLRSATVSIANDDSNENPYNFDIQGTGILSVNKVGLYDPDTKIWRMRAGNTWSDSVSYLQWGATGWTPVVGDWDNDGEDEVGHYDPATGIWRMRAGNTWSDSVSYLQWGAPGWIPVTGDWDNDGDDEVGHYDPATKIWRLKSANTWNASVTYLQWGASGWIPVTGDWDNDGYDEVGHYDPATGIWRLKSDNTWNASVTYLQWGASGWKPVLGDWDGDGVDEVGHYDPATLIWRLKSDNTWNASVQYLLWGSSGWTPVTGDW